MQRLVFNLVVFIAVVLLLEARLDDPDLAPLFIFGSLAGVGLIWYWEFN